MKLMPHLKKGLTVYLKDLRILIISFILLPIILSLVYGNMQKDMFQGKEHSIEAVKVDFQYNETTPKGAVFKNMLEQDKVKELISVGKGDSEYSVKIDDDFKTVEIKGTDEGAAQFMILKNFMKVVINNFNQYELLQSTVNSLKMGDADKAKLVAEILSELNGSNGESVIKERIVEGYKTLNSIEYYTISIFSFTAIVMIVNLAGYFYKEVKEGIVKRTLSTPSDKRNYFLGFIFTTFIVTTVITALYILINRIRGVAFQSSLIYLLIVVLLQSFLTATAVGLVIAFIKKEMTANMIMNLVLIVPSIFGGAFFYSELIGPKILRTIFNSMPNSLILNTYKDLAITGSLRTAQGQLITMAVLSAAFLVVSLLKIERKWEVW